MQNNFFNEGYVLQELHKMENKINEEKSEDKKTNLRFEMLMKGIMLTQNPYYSNF